MNQKTGDANLMKQYTAKYFDKTKQIIEKHRQGSKVLLQFFQREDNIVLCGMDEVLELLRKNTDVSKYTIRYLPEGTILKSREVVLELEGFYPEFGL